MLAAPVTVASAVHVLPSVLCCNSAFVWAVPVEMTCSHLNTLSDDPSRTARSGATATAVDSTSVSESVIQSEVVVTPLFAVTLICHWILSPEKVFAGMAMEVAVPGTAISLTVSDADLRQRNFADVREISA